MPTLIRPSTTRSTAALYAKSLLNAVLFFSIFMVAAPWLAAYLVPMSVPIPGWLGTTLGGGLAAAGLLLWLVCLDSFSRRGRGTPLPLDAPAQLVDSGPFSVMRNPIMVGELAVIWGEALIFAKLGLFLYAAAISLGGHLAVVYVEEPDLHRRFGAAYQDYCRRVWRWWPRLRRR